MLLLLVTAVAIQLPPTAMRLDTLLKQASTLSHETMRAGGTMGSHIVVIDAKPRTAAELRQSIADANFGRWRQVGQEWILDEDAVALTDWRRKMRSAILDRIRAAQAALGAEEPLPSAELAKKLEEVDQGFKASPFVDPIRYSTAARPFLNRTAIQVAVDRVVAKLDPEILLDQPQNVFTSHPNRLQNPLPANAAAEVAAFTRAQAAWSGMAGSFSPPSGGPRWAMTDPRAMTAAPPAGGLRLFLSTSSAANGCTILAYFADASGKVHYQATQSLSFPATASENAETKLDSEVAITIPPEMGAFLSAFPFGPQSGPPAPVLPEIRSRLMTPDRFDPLDPVGATSARLLAKSQKVDLVAWLPDTALRSFVMADPRGTTTAERLRRSLRTMGLEMEMKEGWAVMRPRDPQPNLDRPAFAALLREVDRVGYVPFDRLLDFASKGNYNRPASLVDPILEAILPRSTMLLDRVDPTTLAFFASLPAAQRTTLMADGTLAWANLSEPSQRLIEKATLRSRSLMVQGTQGGSGPSLKTDPTELLGGLDASAIRLTGTSQDAVGVLALGTWSARQRRDGGLTALWNLATSLVARRKGGAPRDNLPETIDRYLPGQIRDRRITVEFAPGISLPLMLRVGEVDLRQAGVPLEGLPETVRKQLNEYLDQASKRDGR